MNMKLKTLDAVRENLSLPNEKCFARNFAKKIEQLTLKLQYQAI